MTQTTRRGNGFGFGGDQKFGKGEVCTGFFFVFFLQECIWVFPKIGGKTPKWMVKIMENPINMDDLGVPFFLETPISSWAIYEINP